MTLLDGFVIAAVLCAAVLCVGVWGLLREPRLPVWVRVSWFPAVFCAAVLWAHLVMNAQPVLFPDTSPCYPGPYDYRLFPPDSYCVTGDGIRHSINGIAPKALFWILALYSTALFAAGLWHAARAARERLVRRPEA